MVSSKDKISDNVDIITLAQVGVLINRKGAESVKKWLKDNNVTVYRYGKMSAVYKIDLECTLILPRVKNFKREYPLQWENYFNGTIKDKALFDLILLKLDIEKSYTPIPKIKLKSKSDNKLFQKFA